MRGTSFCLLVLLGMQTARVAAQQPSAALPPALAPLGASEDARTVDLLNACPVEVQGYYMFLLEAGFRWPSDRTLGSVAADAYSRVLIGAQLAARESREEAARTWGIFEQLWFEELSDESPDDLFLRCLTKRRVWQIDRKAPAEPMAEVVLGSAIDAALSLPGEAPKTLNGPGGLVSVPLKGANLDVVSEDLIRACPSAAAAAFISLFSEPSQPDPTGPAKSARVSLFTDVRVVAGRGRQEADEARQAYGLPGKGLAPLYAFRSCLNSRRVQQWDSALLRVLPR